MNNTYDIADFIKVGGGNEFPPEQRTFTEQQVTKDIDVVVVQQTDWTPILVTGVIVPLVIAAVGWWLQSRWRKEHPGVPLTIANIKKAREK